MSISYVSQQLRRLVVTRADNLCEYCLIAEKDTFLGCEVDHIISEKHSGPTEAGNLAYACVFCNQAKGSDIGSIDWESGEFVRFFNPRMDQWWDHFLLSGNKIEAKTKIGAVTANILLFNIADRLLERKVLRALNRYPRPEALKRMQS
jgi:5-methylcytosine-specific restriction endonuclease McrA